MSNNHYDQRSMMPNHDRIAAPIPLYRPEQSGGYAGFTSMISGEIVQGSWNCGCGPRPGQQAYGIKAPENVAIDPSRAYYSELNCGGQPTTCNDPRALTYLNNGLPSEHTSCVYGTASSRQECAQARVPSQSCFRYPFNVQ